MDRNDTTSTSTGTTSTGSSSSIRSIRTRIDQLQKDIQQQQLILVPLPTTTPTTTTNTTLNNDTTVTAAAAESSSSLSSSFQLGMKLFGSYGGNSNVNSMKQLLLFEETIQQYEIELQQIAAATATATTTTTNNHHHHHHHQQTSNNDDEYEYEYDTKHHDEMASQQQPLSSFNVESSMMVEWLQMKLVFLKECSIAQSLLDSSIQSSSSSSSYNVVSVPDYYHDPSNNNHNENSNNSNNNDKNNNHTRNTDPLQQSTLLLLQSQESLQKAYHRLQQYQQHIAEDNNGNYTDATFSEQQQQQVLLSELYHIYDTIQTVWRRQKITIVTMMNQIWDTASIQLSTTTSLSIVVVVNGKSSNVSSSSTNNHHHQNNPLRTFCNVYQVLAKYANPKNGSYRDTTTTTTTTTTTNQYHNHHMFQMIQSILQKWTVQIQMELLTPILQEFLNYKNTNNNTAVLSSSSSSSSTNHVNPNIRFTTRTITYDNTTSGNTNTATATSSSTAPTLQQERRIEWTITPTKITGSCASTNDNDERVGQQHEEELRQIQQQFQNAMIFIQRIFIFIADEILLLVPQEVVVNGNDDDNNNNNQTIRNHAVGQYIAQRFFGNATTLASTALFSNPTNNNTDDKNSRRDAITTIDGKQLFHDDNIPRLGNDDDGLFIQPLIEVIEHIFLLPHATIEPQQLYTTIHNISQQIQTIMNPFLQELSSRGMIPQHGYERINKFISNMDQLYVSNVRCQLLNRARTIILTNDYHNTITVGTTTPMIENDNTATTTTTTGTKNYNNNNNNTTNTNLDFLPYQLQVNGLDIFQLQKASISTTAHEILLLCRQIMDQVVAISSIVAGVVVSDNDDDDDDTKTGHFEYSNKPTTVPILPYLQVLPALLYRTARDVFDLYRAMVPIQYGYEIHNVPRTAAIHHNDGVYFAHHCSILGLEYKHQLFDNNTNNDMLDATDHCVINSKSSIDKENTQNSNSNDNDKNTNTSIMTSDGNNDDFSYHGNGEQRNKLLRQTCVFVDMVPLFRDLAEQSINHMIQFQCQQLYELVGERIQLFGYALKSNEIVIEWSDATEMAYHAGLYHLRHVYHNWLPPILSTDVFNRTIGYLIDVFFTLYLDQIGKATDISSVACPFLHTFFQKVIYDINVLWNTTTGSRQQKQYYSRVYDKFIAIGQFMNMSMTDIQDGLSNGMFRTVTGPELSRLIISCFDDTPKRQTLLKLISTNQ